jgi:hypothetical protein
MHEVVVASASSLKLPAIRLQEIDQRAATNASNLLSSRLHQLTPLPKDELALKRNINQIAKAVSGGGDGSGTVRGEFCSALRDNIQGALNASLASWAGGMTVTTSNV